MTPAYTLEQLVEILEFKREVMTQMLLASSLLAVLAMTATGVLLSSHERSRLRSMLLCTLLASTLIYVFAIMLDVIIFPAMKHNGTHARAGQIQGLLTLSSLVVWAMIAGTVPLFAGLGAMGFLYSRRVGTLTLAFSGTVLCGFLLCCIFLDRVIRS